MSSSRNLAILGLAVFIGLCVPTWVNKVKSPVNTGRAKIMHCILGLLFHKIQNLTDFFKLELNITVSRSCKDFLTFYTFRLQGGIGFIATTMCL